MKIKDPAGKPVTAELANHNDGTYTATFDGCMAGTYHLEVKFAHEVCVGGVRGCGMSMWGGVCGDGAWLERVALPLCAPLSRFVCALHGPPLWEMPFVYAVCRQGVLCVVARGAPQGRAVLNGEKKSVPVHSFPKKAHGHTMCWRWAVGDWRLVAVSGGWWCLAAAGGWGLDVPR